MRNRFVLAVLVVVVMVGMSACLWATSFPQDANTFQIYHYPVHITGITYEADVDSAGRLQVDIGDSITIEGVTIEVSLGVLEDSIASEGSAASKGTQISLDNGTNTTFAQCNGSGDLKVTLDSETVSVNGATLETISTNMATVAGMVSGGHGQVDVLSIPSHAVTNAGTFAVQSNLMTAWGTSTNLALTVANTEYSASFSNLHRLQFLCRSAVDVRYSDVTGKVAGSVSPFNTLKSGAVFYETDLNIASLTLYFATSSTGVTMEILAW